MRERLSKPLGRLIAGEELSSEGFARLVSGATFVVAVGDRVTDTLAGMGRVPDVQVVDGRERRVARKPPEARHERLIRTVNPAGAITSEAMEALRTAMEGEKPARVLVEGEEDLLAIPAVALAPPGAAVFYGQPGEGVVVVAVDAAAKERSRSLLAEMGVPPGGLS